MANWYGNARSNYVRVKDETAFRAWVATLPGVELVEKEGSFALLAGYDNDTGAWPSIRYVTDDEPEEINLSAEIAVHLAAGEVFVYCEVGAEKLRYLTGWATAVRETGETLDISIEDIYSLVEERWNCKPTLATD